jgi:hypothetical protein
MAEYKKFAVIPAGELKQREELEQQVYELRRQLELQQQQQPSSPQRPETPQTPETPPPPPPPTPDTAAQITPEKIDQVLEVLPKNLRHRGRVLMYWVKNHHTDVGMDDAGHVIYNDKSRGSHLYTLIRYVLASGPFTPYRPEDISRFLALIKDSPITPPKPKQQQPDLLLQWQNLY